MQTKLCHLVKYLFAHELQLLELAVAAIRMDGFKIELALAAFSKFFTLIKQV